MILHAHRDVVIFYLNNINRVCSPSGRLSGPWESSVNWLEDKRFTKAAPMEFVKWQD